MDFLASRFSCLLHQQHLTGTFHRAGKLALKRCGQAGIFSQKNAAVVGHISAQQGYVPVIKLVDGKIYLGCGARSTAFHRSAVCIAAAFFTSIGICLTRHI